MFKKMYFLLFNRISDAIEELKQGNAARAMAVLVRAQQEAEELNIETTERQDFSDNEFR